MDAETFYNETIGKKFDLDGVPAEQPYQCADYFKQACHVTLGYHWACGGDGYVDNWWYNRTDSMKKDFEFVRDWHELKNGDFVIWANASRGSTPFNLSHIAMYHNGYMVGQNQPHPYVNRVYEPESVWSQMLGAFRFKKWQEDAHKEYNDLKQVNAEGTEKSTRKVATSFHVYRKKDSPVQMTKKTFKYAEADITAIQCVLSDICDLGLSYVGYPDWLCSLHNDWYEGQGYEEIMAVNAGYFEMDSGKPVGAVLQDWQGEWSQFNGEDCVPARDNGYPTLGWNGYDMVLLNKNADEIDRNAYAWLCGVGQSLVLNGEIDNSIGTENGRFEQKNCATAIGFNHETRTVTFMINSKVGLNTSQRSAIMRGLGCDIAVQLDGGGSAQLEWLERALTENESSEDEKPSESLPNDAVELLKEILNTLKRIEGKL